MKCTISKRKTFILYRKRGVFWFRREMEVIEASQGVVGLVKNDIHITGKSVNNVVDVDFTNNEEALQLAA